MAIGVGTRLGVYEVTGTLGAGGMGEVHRATDTKLGREVAIKTLPAALASDKDRLARFEREAKLLATLNHAHIAAIYGLDEHDGTLYLAMELVEGETLEEKLKEGPLRVEDALHVALQVAEALEAAHEKGVVHRDLKPANIMVTAGGQVKVLDFGLAKAFSGDPDAASPAHSPALSVAMTQQGLILGTAGYMSPEQASGQATDQRADVWAFGVVLYEMLTGLPLFSGESVPHILAAVLQTEPDWSRLPKHLHPRLRLLLERCLEKKVRNRYYGIADARVDIEKILNDPRGITGPTAIVEPARPLWKRALPFSAATLVIGALLAGGLTWSLTRPESPTPAPVTRFAITPPATAPLAGLRGYNVAISPDGKRLAYVAEDPENGNVKLYVRDLDGLAARAVPGTEAAPPTQGDVNPVFSPDGQSIAFRRGQAIMRVSLNGQSLLKIVDDSSQAVFSGAWTPDGTLIYSSAGKSGPLSLYRVSAGGGGTPRRLAPSSALWQFEPALLPGGQAVLFTVFNAAAQKGVDIAVLDLRTGKVKILIKNGAQPSYARTGDIVFVRGETLMAVPFDPDRLVVTGQPKALLRGIGYLGVISGADYALSDSGTLVYVPAAADKGTKAKGALVWVGRDGRVVRRAVSDLIESPRNPRLSPDGGRLVVTTGAPAKLWVYDLSGRPPIPLAKGNDAVWSPDSARIAYTSNRNVYIAPADGSVPNSVPLRHGGLQAAPAGWSANGELILQTAAGNIVATSADGKGKVRDVVATSAREYDPALSPNGHWLAYTSDLTGRPEVWVKGYPKGDPKRVSANGGSEPIWSHDGKELFYLQGHAMMAVPVKADEKYPFGSAKKLFTGPYFISTSPGIRSYDVARDGRFLMIQPSAPSAQPAHIVVVQNWFEELKRRMSTK